MDLDCIEIERRLAIGFNDQLSISRRHELVSGNLPLEEISGLVPGFELYNRETRDVIHWLSRSTLNRVIWYGEPGYPSFMPLRAHLPYMLFCQGEIPGNLACAAIVGTRHATYAGLQQAFRFGLEASENSVCVASGFAEGIDQSAMRGSISGGGPCIGVLACGHDVEYPALTAGLRKAILDGGGCVISRFAPSAAVYKSNFISRNMVISALATFAVAVQAPQKSGTLNTCDYSVQMGKEIFVGSEGVGDRFVQVGTTALFKDGAKVITSLSDVPSVKMRFMVEEVMDDVASEPCKEAELMRFGDRRYMVRDRIC